MRLPMRVFFFENCLAHPAAWVFWLLSAGNTHWWQLGWVLFSEICLAHPAAWVRLAWLFYFKNAKKADASYLPKSQTKNLTLGGRYLTHQPLCNILF